MKTITKIQKDWLKIVLKSEFFDINGFCETPTGQHYGKFNIKKWIKDIINSGEYESNKSVLPNDMGWLNALREGWIGYKKNKEV